MTTETTNPLEMSDEDFMKHATSPEAVGITEIPEAVTTDEDQSAAGGGSEVVVEDKTEDKSAEAVVETPVVVENKETANVVETSETKTEGQTAEVKELPAAASTGSTDDTKSSETQTEEKQTEVETPVNYEESYKKIMAPFKANGKTIELRDPTEAVKLMQMGANYTRRMQELTPHRKTLMMLEANGIDQDKLSYLIDLDKKNPEAIRKLVKDSGMDVMDIDTSAETNYVPGNHQVPDEAVAFNTTLEDLASTPEGKETLVHIQSWDDTSKNALWSNPELMTIMHEQRENGVYDRITAEIDRRRTLGAIPANTPFLEAYNTIGQEMTAKVMASRGQTGGQSESGTLPPPNNTGEVLATRAAAPKSAVKDDDRASAASTTRTTPKTAGEIKNPLAMSDDEFLKQFEGRL